VAKIKKQDNILYNLIPDPPPWASGSGKVGQDRNISNPAGKIRKVNNTATLFEALLTL
jgi:hypothetical protein